MCELLLLRIAEKENERLVREPMQKLSVIFRANKFCIECYLYLFRNVLTLFTTVERNISIYIS